MAAAPVYLVHVVSLPVKAPVEIDAVADKSSRLDMLIVSVQRRQILGRCRIGYLLPGID